MSIGTKDSSYYHRVEGAVCTLATSTDSPVRRIEFALSSIHPLVLGEPKDPIDEKLWKALALASTEKAEADEGKIHATLSKADSSTLKEIMTLIFDAYREMLKGSPR